MNNILLCGNPNVGKSSLFNMLTSSSEHTGNWTGKTVDVVSKRIKNTNYNLIDLPGVYSLSCLSEEENVTRNYLLFEDYEKIIYVCDASNLDKNLNLLLQILDINKNVILCLNMIDEINNKGIYIDTSKLSNILNIPVICTSVRNKIGIHELINTLDSDLVCNYNINYTVDIEYKINEISKLIEVPFNNRFISLKVLERDNDLIKEFNNRYNINIINDEVRRYLYNIDSEYISDCVSFKINSLSNKISSFVYKRNKEKEVSKLDKLISSKYVGIPLFIFMMFIIFFITINLSNYPCELLGNIFNYIESLLVSFVNKICIPSFIYEPLIYGVYRIMSFIISVMFPPLVIFFFLFTLAEESGVLPRISFNTDYIFNKCNSHGKQCLTVCSGFGCNACAIVGSRIIDSKRDRLIAILTNSFIPCNGRLPMIICMINIFFVNNSNKLWVTLYLTLFILFSMVISLIVSFILSKTILKGYKGFFVLEMPDYKRVNLINIIKISFINKSLDVLKRTIKIAIPSGLLIYFLCNININDINLFRHISFMFDSFSRFIGLDGVTILSFIIGVCANEIVLPLILMGYTNTLMLSNDFSFIYSTLISNGWNIYTAISFIIFTIMHFPCATTLFTIKDEVGFKWMIYSIIIPLLTGIIFLFIFNIFI